MDVWRNKKLKRFFNIKFLFKNPFLLYANNKEILIKIPFMNLEINKREKDLFGKKKTLKGIKKG